MADMTKDEIRAELEKLHAAQPPDWATKAELIEALHGAESEITEDWDAVGDTVRYCLTADDAASLTAREVRFARSVKAVAPFTPRVYSEGDALGGTVVSAFEDGTVSFDLVGIVPRVTLERVPEGDEPGTYRKRG